MDGRCAECGGRIDRPGLWGCREEDHPRATRAQRIVWAIESELNDRRGMRWSGIDQAILDELRDTLTEIVEGQLAV